MKHEYDEMFYCIHCGQPMEKIVDEGLECNAPENLIPVSGLIARKRMSELLGDTPANLAGFLMEKS